jgi:HEPN domain-containing protein
MYLKAALIRKGRQISPSDTWGHDLEALLKDLAGEAEFPELVYNCAKIFNDYFDELRYPRRLKSVEGIGETEGWLLEEAIPFLLPYAKGPRIMT